MCACRRAARRHLCAENAHKDTNTNMKKWTIDKKQLIQACEVLSLVPTRPGLPSSEYFQLESRKSGVVQVTVASEVTATVDLKGTGEWPFQKAFYLDRRVFLPFVFAAKDLHSEAPFEFSRKEKQLILHQGTKRKAGFDGSAPIPGYGFPPSGVLKSRINLGNHVRGLIYCARECAGADPVTPQLHCVYVQPNGTGVDVLATNQKIVYSAKAKTVVKNKEPIPFPLFLVPLLGSNQLTEIHWREKYVALTFPNGMIWQPVSAKARKDFPAKEITKHMAKLSDTQLLFVSDVKQISRLVGRMVSYLSAVRRQDWALDIIGSKGSKKLFIGSKVPQVAFRETIQLKHPAKSDFKISWPLDMLDPIFEYLRKKDKGSLEVRLGKRGVTYIIGQDVKVAVAERLA